LEASGPWGQKGSPFRGRTLRRPKANIMFGGLRAWGAEGQCLLGQDVAKAKGQQKRGGLPTANLDDGGTYWAAAAGPQ